MRDALLGAGVQGQGASSAFRDLRSSEEGRLNEKQCSGCDKSHDGGMNSSLDSQGIPR